MTIEPSNILIIEDMDETRRWLRGVVQAVFPSAAIDEAAHLQQAREVLAGRDVDFALIDIHLPDGCGIDLVREIRQRPSATYCVMATVFDDDFHLFDALRAGAQGYLLKDQNSEQIAAQLSGVASGQPPLSPAIARRLLHHFSVPPEHELTPREVDVLTLIARGLRLKDVAGELGISVHTVGDHVKNIYRKLQVSNRAEATLQAVRRGLIKEGHG